MHYPTPSDIEEMKARRHDPATIEAAIRKMELGQKAQEVSQMIEKAFLGVKLGNGIGLRQALGLDDYADEVTCAAYRLEDEKDDWRLIASEDLCACSSSLSFFDAEGMRFHLPAFLIADLRGEYGMGMDFPLTHQATADHPTFSLLSPQQRLSVRMYLLHILHDPNYALSRDDILHALEHYWIWPPELAAHA